VNKRCASGVLTPFLATGRMRSRVIARCAALGRTDCGIFALGDFGTTALTHARRAAVGRPPSERMPTPTPEEEYVNA